MRIFLTGFMGSGKTTSGRRLASRLGYDFVDLDDAIELETGLTIGELFRESEMRFREKEREVLLKLINLDNSVIATGGGTPCFFDNMTWMNRHGLTIYLSLTNGSLFHRLAPSKENRPLICHMGDIELMEYIMDSLVIREPYYKMSAITVTGEDLDVNRLSDRINSKMYQLQYK